jgi:hypothetical protein
MSPKNEKEKRRKLLCFEELDVLSMLSLKGFSRSWEVVYRGLRSTNNIAMLILIFNCTVIFFFFGLYNLVSDLDAPKSYVSISYPESLICLFFQFFICYLPFRDLKIEIYCWSPSGNHKPMGSCHTTLRRHTPHTPDTLFLPFVTVV